MREEVEMTLQFKLSLPWLQLLRLAHSKVADVPISIHRSEGIPTPLSVQQMSCVVLVQIAEGLNSKHTLVRGPVLSYMYLTYLPT